MTAALRLLAGMRAAATERQGEGGPRRDGRYAQGAAGEAP